MTILNIRSAEELDKEIADEYRTVIVDFWSNSSGPSRVMEPVLEYFTTEYGNKAVIFKVNVDDLPELAEKYEVTSLPTFLVFKDGKLREDRIHGSVTASVLAADVL